MIYMDNFHLQTFKYTIHKLAEIGVHEKVTIIQLLQPNGGD